MARAFLAALLWACAAALPQELRHGLRSAREHLATVPVHMYRADCRRQSLLQAPGAGMDQSGLKPFQQVLKDGYFEVACVKDYLLAHGDKFGNNKFSYEAGSVPNVSVVIYSDVVGKEQQEPMTHAACFAFCRTVPDMLFFGLQNGRTCYCAPYFQPMASDDSTCDAPCEGDPTTMCGGKEKSSIFEMHACTDTKEEVQKAARELATAGAVLAELEKQVSATASAMQTAATELQQSLGVAGDVVASGLMQSAKELAGELQHAGEDAKALAAQLADLHKLANSTKDLNNFDAISKAERLVDQSDGAVERAEAAANDLGGLLDAARPLVVAEGAAEQYYNVMYFVDKAFAATPSTCGGQAVGKPLLGSVNACASACDSAVGSCVGYSHFPHGAAAGLCFLFAKVTSATYYTGCGSGGFLQRAANATGAVCAVKLSHFEGTTLKPDPSGKCEQCLTEVTKAQRCFS